MDPTRKKDLRRPEPFTFAKVPVRGPGPLPNAPPRQERQDRPVPPNLGPEHRARGVDDKLSTLRDYWRTCGLCFWCGEKWSRDHRCPGMFVLLKSARKTVLMTVMKQTPKMLCYAWLSLWQHLARRCQLIPFSSWAKFRGIQFEF